MSRDPGLPPGCTQDDLDREADPHYRRTGEWPWPGPVSPPTPASEAAWRALSEEEER